MALLKSLSNLEISLMVIFAIYLVLPIQTPAFMAEYVDSPLGMVAVFIVTLYLFFNANPLVAVLYLFVAYELMRRSSEVTGRVAMIRYTPTQIKKNAKMKAINPKKVVSLEEDIVERMAPIGHSDISVYTSSSFKPVSENIKSASLY